MPPDSDTGAKGYYNYNKEGYSLPTIVDLLENQNLSWKCYAESLPDGYKDQLKYNFRSSPQTNLKRVLLYSVPRTKQYLTVLVVRASFVARPASGAP